MRTQSIIAYIYLNRLKERFFIYFFSSVSFVVVSC